MPNLVDTHTMFVTRQASEVLTSCGRQVAALGAMFGESDPRTTKAAMSLAHNVTQLFNMFFGSDSRITKDGDLSLFVSTSSSFVYGLIFHSSYYRVVSAPDDGGAYGAAVRHLHCFTCDVPVVYKEVKSGPNNEYMRLVRDETHDTGDHVLMSAPTPGTWSFHS